MNKIFKNNNSSSIFGITSCSYKPILVEKNYDFQIDELF